MDDPSKLSPLSALSDTNSELSTNYEYAAFNLEKAMNEQVQARDGLESDASRTGRDFKGILANGIGNGSDVDLESGKQKFVIGDFDEEVG